MFLLSVVGEQTGGNGQNDLDNDGNVVSASSRVTTAVDLTVSRSTLQKDWNQTSAKIKIIIISIIITMRYTDCTIPRALNK